MFVAADPNLRPDECKVYKVAGLATTCTIASYGYLVFCKSRSCNAAFYEWFNTEIILPLVEELENDYVLVLFTVMGKKHKLNRF